MWRGNKHNIGGPVVGLTGGALVMVIYMGGIRKNLKKTIFNRKLLSLAKKLFNKFIQEYNNISCKDII